jgi:hypothetical protein
VINRDREEEVGIPCEQDDIISLPSKVNIVAVMFTGVCQCLLEIGDPNWLLWALAPQEVKSVEDNVLRCS